MYAKVYCIASPKGGSGKTMVTANIASFVAQLGKKCLIVDCDAATHGMTLLYIVEVSSHKHPERRGVFDQQDVEKAEVENIMDSSIVNLSGNVDLMPATFKFGHDESITYFTDENVFSETIVSLRSSYDYIFLDAQAGADTQSRIAMGRKISDEVVIVSEYDPMSAAGVERLKQMLGADLDYSRTWTLLNKMLPEFVEQFSEFLSVTKYLPPIPWNAEVVRAYAKRTLALNLEIGNEYTLAIMRTVEVLMSDGIGQQIEEWIKERAYAIRAPLEEQYKATEQELELALGKRFHVMQEQRRSVIMQTYGVMSAVVVFFALVMASPVSNAVQKILWMFGDFSAVIALIIVLLLVVPVLLLTVFRFSRKEKTVEIVRYDRIIAMLEEKLEQLAVLRSSDYETIVRRSRSSN